MPIAIICPSCGHRAGAKEEWIGRQVKCPGCGTRITVDAAAPPRQPTPQQRPPAQQRPATQQRGSSGRPGAGGVSRPAPRAPASDYEGGLPDVFGSLPADDPLNMVLGGGAVGNPLGPAKGGAPLGRRGATGARKKANGSGKILWIAAGAVGGLLVLVGVGVIASGVLSRSKAPPPQAPIASVASAAELPAWSADAALLNQLGGEVSFDRYSLRLPPGYQPLHLTAARRAPPGVQNQTWAWCDAAAADGTRHVIEARLASVSDMPHRNDLEAEVNAYLQNARSDAASAAFTPGATATGQVCGGPFARLTYSVATPQATVHTISLLGFDGNDRMLTLVCVGKEPAGTEAFQLLETSLLSLKRN